MKSEGALVLAQEVLTYLKNINAPVLKPRVLEETDKGPGVSVWNSDVWLRDAEKARQECSDYRMHIHLATHDTCPAERVNAAIGDAVVDGGSLKCDYFSVFEDMSDEEISALSNEQIEELEESAVEKNAWSCCYDIVLRVDGAAGPHGTMESYVTEKENGSFFYNGEYLKLYQNRKDIEVTPGYHYFKKIEEFFKSHHERGDNYFEYIKFGCSDTGSENCEFCRVSGWSGLPISQCPRPYPDHSKLLSYQYKAYSDTPTAINGQARLVDDYQPRINVRKEFENGTLKKEDDPDTITHFADKFIVEVKHVVSYVDHLTLLHNKKIKQKLARTKLREDIKRKAYSDHDWQKLVTDGTLRKLQVIKLNKYFRHHSFEKDIFRKSKKEKILMITAHLTKNALASQSRKAPHIPEMRRSRSVMRKRTAMMRVMMMSI